MKGCVSFEPITIIGGIVLSGAGVYFKDKVKDLTYCKFTECCNDEYVFETYHSNLRNAISRELFGQHIATDLISQAVSAHTARAHSGISKKPLVLSLHGTPGTGKNFVSELLIKALYKNGVKSDFVHKFLGRSDFPLQNRVNEYKVSSLWFYSNFHLWTCLHEHQCYIIVRVRQIELFQMEVT